jgi:hypothetical protein
VVRLSCCLAGLEQASRPCLAGLDQILTENLKLSKTMLWEHFRNRSAGVGVVDVEAIEEVDGDDDDDDIYLRPAGNRCMPAP